MPLIFALILTFLTLATRPVSSPPPSLPSPSPSATPSPLLPSPTPVPRTQQAPPDSALWGVAQKIADHTYQIKIQNDPIMGSPADILSALNNLRARHGAQPLHPDPRLCTYAQSRAQLFAALGRTDAHAGFEDFLENQNGFVQLGYNHIGENSSYGYILSGVHLIEFVYMQSPEHNANQLNPDWDRGCVGVAGVATNLIFATAPI